MNLILRFMQGHFSICMNQMQMTTGHFSVKQQWANGFESKHKKL